MLSNLCVNVLTNALLPPSPAQAARGCGPVLRVVGAPQHPQPRARERRVLLLHHGVSTGAAVLVGQLGRVFQRNELE